MTTAFGIHHVTGIARDAQQNVDFFVTNGVGHTAPSRRFGESVIAFKDRDGLQLELVATESADARGSWSGGSVPTEHAIHGVHSVTLWEHSLDLTEQVLVEGLGFRKIATEDTTTRFAIGDGGASKVVDVRVVGGFLAPVGGAGVIHHVAFRAEPGGVLFELATDAPGFEIDESLGRLGTALKLLPQYEPSRSEIEHKLGALHEPLLPPLLGVHDHDAVTS
ncbi:MAG: hypothetical protein ABIT20_16995 [Gemmatimonadaceae bacterium]